MDAIREFAGTSSVMLTMFMLEVSLLELTFFHVTKRSIIPRLLIISAVICLIAATGSLAYWGLLVIFVGYALMLWKAFSGLRQLRWELELSGQPHKMPIFLGLLTDIERYGHDVPLMRWAGLSWRWLMEQKLRGLANEVRSLIEATIVRVSGREPFGIDDTDMRIQPLCMDDLRRVLDAASEGDFSEVDRRLKCCREEMLRVAELSDALVDVVGNGPLGDDYHRANMLLLRHLSVLGPYTHATEILAAVAGRGGLLQPFETADFSDTLFEAPFTVAGERVRWKMGFVADGAVQDVMELMWSNAESVHRRVLEGAIV